MSLFDRIKNAFGFGPTLRNKPGGMAYIVGMNRGGGEVVEGRIVQTVRTYFADGVLYWHIEPPQDYEATAHLTFPGGLRAEPGNWLRVIGLADECLVPLKDPGDEEQDESARWLPPVPASPVPVKEAA